MTRWGFVTPPPRVRKRDWSTGPLPTHDDPGREPISATCESCGRKMLSTAYLYDRPDGFMTFKGYTACPHCGPVQQAAEMI